TCWCVACNGKCYCSTHRGKEEHQPPQEDEALSQSSQHYSEFDHRSSQTHDFNRSLGKELGLSAFFDLFSVGGQFGFFLTSARNDICAVDAVVKGLHQAFG